MKDLPKTSKTQKKDLVPDGNRKKPPISKCKLTIVKDAIPKLVNRESITSDLSSSRPNSTASEGGVTTTDDEDDDDDDDGDNDDIQDNDDGNGNNNNNITTTECSESAHESTSDDDDENDDGAGKSGSVSALEPISEEITLRKQAAEEDNDDSTCCDEDFTWVRPDPLNEPRSLPAIPLSSTSTSNSNNNNNCNNMTSTGKPPRPSGSLDRRRITHTSRQERDHKSRSTHSLKEKSLSNEFKDFNQNKSNYYLENYYQQDINNTNYSPYQYHHHHHHLPHTQQHHNRGSPGFWDAPPPPPPPQHTIPYPPWEPPYYYNYHGTSREDLRMIEYHRRQLETYRYGSNGTLSASQELYTGGSSGGGGGGGGGGSNCYLNTGNRYPSQPPPLSLPPPPPPPCCSYEHRSLPWNVNQRQDTDERLRRFQTDKESLALQVQVLSEQVSAQTEKIQDLEKIISDKNQLLNNTEDLLQREMLSRSSLETQKLELMSAMSELKLQQAALERENLELRANYLNNNSIINSNGSNNNTNNVIPLRKPPVPMVVGTGSGVANSRIYTSGNSLSSTNSLHGSHNSLQNTTSTSLITPKTPPSSYRRQMDIQYNSLPRQTFPSSVTVPTIASLQPPIPIPVIPTSSSSSSSVNAQILSSSDTTPGSNATNISNNPQPQLKQRNVAFGKNFQLLPKSASKSATNVYHHQLVLYKQPQSLKSFETQRGFSVPNLAETEKIIEDNGSSGDGMDLPRSFTPQPSPSPSMSQKSKGLRSIFGKIKRSNSGNLEDLPSDGDFKRGGVRATASARLGGWNNALTKPDKPFIEWDIDTVCIWLDELGLGNYEDEARKWLKKGGSELVSASPVDIERELNLKSALHRKKIILAINDLTAVENDELFINAGKLDTAWIMRWLDDIGLPQHKDTFSNARIDGRVLHKLTMDDLVNLHVTSALHGSSLRRGIQVMRENFWNPECLIRRSGTEEENVQKQVHLWTAHRVMEWLRVVDLAEYAPNLRGAGIHGALMMYENRFTSELLADLLCIPPSKTLLRRHLGTHFKELLGRDVIQMKREAEATLGFQPLTIFAKIKTPKKSQFSLKRKKSTKGGDEWSDYVCPMGPSGDQLLQNTSSNQTNMMNPAVQEVVAAAEVASQPNSNDSPTSSRSSNS